VYAPVGSLPAAPRPLWLRLVAVVGLLALILSSAGIFPYSSPAPWTGPTRFPFPAAWLTAYRDVLSDTRFALAGLGALWALGVPAASVLAVSRRAVLRAAAVAVPITAITMVLLAGTSGGGVNGWGLPSAISTGISEELFWRAGILGAALTFIRSRRPIVVASVVVGCSAAFGAWHFNSHLQIGGGVVEALSRAIVVHTLSGIAASVLYLVWRDIGVAVLAHVLVDVAAQVTGDVSLVIYAASMYGCFTLLVVLGLRRHRHRVAAARDRLMYQAAGRRLAPS
jgi:hypothetical protein